MILWECGNFILPKISSRKADHERIWHEREGRNYNHGELWKDQLIGTSVRRPWLLKWEDEIIPGRPWPSANASLLREIRGWRESSVVRCWLLKHSNLNSKSPKLTYKGRGGGVCLGPSGGNVGGRQGPSLAASGPMSLSYMEKPQASERACVKQKVESAKGHLRMPPVFHTCQAHRYPETGTHTDVYTHVPKTQICAV